MTPESLFLKVRAALESVGIPYMVTGSFVSGVHGVPRATHDLDVIIAPTAQQLRALIAQFPDADFYAELEDALQAFRHQSQFNVIDQHSIWKIDFIIRKDRPFSRAEFDRRRVLDILGVALYAASPEDLVIAKLEWSKLGDSERQIRDAAGIIEVQGDGLNVEYIERWVAALELEEQWQKALASANA